METSDSDHDRGNTAAVDSHRADFGHRHECVLEAVSVCTQVDVDYLDGHLEHGEDVLRHLTVRTLRLGEHDHTVLVDDSSNKRLCRLRPTECRQRRSHSKDVSLSKVQDLSRPHRKVVFFVNYVVFFVNEGQLSHVMSNCSDRCICTIPIGPRYTKLD